MGTVLSCFLSTQGSWAEMGKTLSQNAMYENTVTCIQVFVLIIIQCTFIKSALVLFGILSDVPDYTMNIHDPPPRFLGRPEDQKNTHILVDSRTQFCEL